MEESDWDGPHFPGDLTRDDFCRLYGQQLEAQRAQLVGVLTALLARQDFTSEVRDLSIEVFADESGDGHVSAWCYFNGPNRRISDSEPSLFAGKSVCLTPDMRVPPHDPDAYAFDPADASAAVVIDWVRSCWAEAGGDSYPLPATITGHDAYGSDELLPLNAAARAAQQPRRKKRPGTQV